MRAYLSRRYRISASHRLHSASFTPEQNRLVYGKCNNPHGHGHNYVIEVTVGGQVEQNTGMICNLAELDECVQKEVIARFDHANLNLEEQFSKQIPTTENLCRVVYSLLMQNFTGAQLERVRIEETANNFFEFSGEDHHVSPNHR